ncbi:MAG: hypothetical protein GY793_00750 [Proteobacteria bacterium]|nr:hypothetical protein [Pseudomonadota bacterium]
MKNLILLILLFLISAQICNAEMVKYVYDGDTFTTTDGKKVRLLNINTPETAKKNRTSEPYSIKAKEALKDLVLNKEVKLVFDEEKKDKYKRMLAYVYLKDGTFVNAEILKQGLAHLYSFPKNVSKFEELKKAENFARNKSLGLWSHKRWKIQDANSTNPVEKFRFGKYQVFEGKVKECKAIADKVYLNFAENWRTDFSVQIKDKYFKYFKNANINPETFYCNKKLRIRGILIPVNGALISATHPQQLEILK